MIMMMMMMMKKKMGHECKRCLLEDGISGRREGRIEGTKR
jgi:hypothetical protein